MRAVDVIRTKRDGAALRAAQIEAFVRGASEGSWPDYQLAALLMAVVLRGMDLKETTALTLAMARSGEVLDLSDIPGPKVDKHSTGGVGDKTSLVLAPLAAACGVVVPMMSGRGLGHSGGTLDKLESIPGFRVGLSLPEFRSALREVGCALVSQTREVAPADRVLYALRDVTACVESIPLIVSSILSKKLAEGIEGLVLDVKCGRGAFMKTPEAARELAGWLCEVGRQAGKPTEAVLTAMDVPLGNAVGNALEVKEALAVLRGEGPEDVEELSVLLAARMVGLAWRCSVEEAMPVVRRALASGRGLEKFRAVIARQGGDPRVVDDDTLLPSAPHRHIIRAPRPGYVTDIHAEAVGQACVLLGAGRDRVEDAVDPGVGVVLLARPGAEVRAGDGLLEVHYRGEDALERALPLLQGACTLVDDAPPPPAPLVLDTLAHLPLAPHRDIAHAARHSD